MKAGQGSAGAFRNNTPFPVPPMTETKKKMAAALAAVEAYLHQEQGEATQQKQPPWQPDVSGQPSLWSQSGRQDMMGMRRLMQLRTFTPFR